MQEQAAFNDLSEKLSDQGWRLNNLYKIKDVDGNIIQFKMNFEQQHLFDNMHYFNVILKARQLGFTTFIDIYKLDACLFNSNHAAGIIADTRENAEAIFKNKVRFAYDNLPEWLKQKVTATSESARQLEFSNGSTITVGTSYRGGTLQKLHVSEYGKIAARYPEKALEIKTGALNTVHIGQQIFVESTAEGRQGEFWELCEIARKLKDAGKHLTPLDPKFFFYAWWQHPDYCLSDEDCAGVSVDSEMQMYFMKLSEQGINLTAGQKSWYIKKEALQKDKMKREYPSTPEEAFEASLEGAYYTKQMELVRRNKQIGFIPHEPSKPVHTFWDIGQGRDEMAIWFFQHIGNQYRFIRYHESAGEGWEFYTNLLKSYNYSYGTHYWPHDGNKKIIAGAVQTSKQIAEGLGINPIKIIPRTNDVQADIMNKCRPVISRCFFDEAKCSVGITHLDAYRKEWDENMGQWKDSPRHDASSHCADAFRTFAVGYDGRRDEIRDDFDDNRYGYRPQERMADTEYNMFG